MKFKTLITLFLICFSCLAQENKSDNKSLVDDLIKSNDKFISEHINNQDELKKLYSLSDKEKKEYLKQMAAKVKNPVCFNSEPTRICQRENMINSKIINNQYVIINKIYVNNIRDYTLWQPKRDILFSEQCSKLIADYYINLNNLAEYARGENNQEAISVYSYKNKTILPVYDVEIERERKIFSYSCLNKKWGNMNSYRDSETILNGDCKSHELVEKLGLQKICQ